MYRYLFLIALIFNMAPAVCWQVCVAVTRYLEYHCCWHSSRNFAIGSQMGYFTISQVAVSNIRDRPRTTNHPPFQLGLDRARANFTQILINALVSHLQLNTRLSGSCRQIWQAIKILRLKIPRLNSIPG